jgi:hypothetical protein
MRSVCDQLSVSGELSIEIAIEIIPIYAMLLAMIFYGARRGPGAIVTSCGCSTTFNTFQLDSIL